MEILKFNIFIFLVIYSQIEELYCNILAFLVLIESRNKS
jgi:hypothetical protein